MKKIPALTALALAASICSLAQAQSSVTVYGKLYPYLERESGSGATAVGTPKATLAANPTGINAAPKVNGMSAGNSNIGFRGREDLGGGLKAKFQIEGVVSVDNGAGGQWNRNTFVGLEGGFGEIRLGLMDTVFKEYGDTLGILGISSGTPVSSSNILRKVGFGTNNASRFHERRANSVRYDSPEFFGGWQFGAQWSTQENPTATLDPAKTYSLGVKYDKGPIYVALAYEQHRNWFGGSLNSPTAASNAGGSITSKDEAWQATVEWRVTKDQKLEFDVITKEYKENGTTAGRFRSYKNTAYLVGYDGRFGPWRVMAHYVSSAAGSCSLAAAVCTTTGLEGKQLTAGTAYSLSRRTYLFAAYSKITNGTSARFSANDLNGSVAPGEDVTHVLAGVAHSF